MKFNDLVRFLCLIIALTILWRFRQVLLLVFTSMVLATALNGLVKKLVKTYGMSRIFAVLVTVILSLLVLTVFLFLLVPFVSVQFQQIFQRIPESFRNLTYWLNNFESNLPFWTPESDIKLPNFADMLQQISTLIRAIFGSFHNFFSSSLAILLELLLVIVLTLMFLADPIAYRRLILELFHPAYRQRANEIFSRCEVELLNWLGAFLLNSLFVTICSFIGLLLLRVDFAFTHAIIAGMFNFIPNIGPLLSTVFPLSVALLNSWSQSIAVIVLYVAIQNLESYVFSPAIMHKQVSLLPAATLIAQLFFTVFLGPLGLLLSIPLAVIAKIWIEEAWIKDFLGYEKSSNQDGK